MDISQVGLQLGDTAPGFPELLIAQSQNPSYEKGASTYSPVIS